MFEYDILIIGGGPAGLSTALHIARDFPHLTDRILILEKAYYPRHKLCAGGLIIDAEVILQRLGLDVSEVPHMDAERMHFDFEAKGLNIHTPKHHALRVIRRDEFDHWLARKAEMRGLEIREGVTVRNISPDEDGVTVETDQGDFRTQVVVGADGSNGVTRRCIFPHTSVHTARVLEVITPEHDVIASFQDVAQSPRFDYETDEHTALRRQSAHKVPGFVREREEARNDRQRADAYFEFFPVPQNIAGYVWDFPTQVHGQAMRCWGIYDTNLLAQQKRPPLKEPLAEEMRRFGFHLQDYEIKGHPIRWFSPRNPLAVARVLFAGDVAGADPFLGEGISIALGYGSLAAREIGEAFARNDFSFNRYKQRVIRSPLGQALIIRWLLTHLIYPLKWRALQVFIWRFLKPIAVPFAWKFILNWGKRIRSIP